MSDGPLRALRGLRTGWKHNPAVGVVAILISLLSLAMLLIPAVYKRTAYQAAVKKGREWQVYEEQLGRPPTTEEAQEFFRRQRAGMPGADWR